MSGTGDWLAYGGGIALVIGGSAAFGMAMRPTGPLGRAISRYVARLDAECRFQCYTIDGRQLLGRQLVFLALSIIVCIQMGQPLLWVLPPAVVFGPWFVLRRRRKKRIERIEAQLDGWLQILSNLLRAAGGLGDALAASADLIRAPLRQELDRSLKEIRLGATLDEALRQMGERIKSSTVAAVITLLVVGRRTGGEMPALLESAAAALREMARLEGVIRAKTADGRMQTLVLAAAPIAAVMGFRLVDPRFFDPLVQSLFGYAVLGAAMVFWVMALLSARRILQVDY
ncbi:MAG TPA: type II secretion system F family protein [Kofleriaceae bacterium]|nr:type II secretion system F family protein [Kofleriaceae bacterium]